MGRYIECMIGDEYEIVWKYRFGVQNSEMYRISTDLSIGEYHSAGHSDTLILTRLDIEKLKEHIHLLKISEVANKNQWFIAMLEAIRDFIVEHHAQDKFIFEGEL